MSLHQQFYQRVLAGDSEEIIARGRSFLKSKTFLEYCDAVVVPAIQLASSDEVSGAISEVQRNRAGMTTVRSIRVLSGEVTSHPFWRRPKPLWNSVEPTPIKMLRASRENAFVRNLNKNGEHGQILCTGLTSQFDDVAIELLIRAMEQHQLVATDISVAGLKTFLHEHHGPPILAIVLVNIDLSTDPEDFQGLVTHVRGASADVKLVSLFHPAFFADARTKTPPLFEGLAFQAASFEEVIRECLATVQSPGPIRQA